MIAVGVDAGGTGSRAVVVRDGTVVERRDLGPINVLLHDDALDRLAAAVTGVGAEAAGFGLAGVRSGAHARKIAAELTDRTGARVAVGDDTDAALAGAFRGGPGIVVIAGTGSGAAGQDEAGRTVRVGGHGYLLGDEGGGYWIGREAVRAAMRAADGTGPPTVLTAAVQRAFDSLAGAEQQVHRHPTDRELLARLVPVVARAAGDAEADRILAEAAGHLVDLARAVQDRLGALPLAGVGGIFRCAPVATAFRTATGAAEPAEPPELGALRLLDRPPAA
ncbi:MAG TPA: BadF/BadG/BcrA/BcrD ATPase family protein [Mycobacteriales bacterium]|nr:BadF/BadG/BcrA/BcrD ATPase family protein [Mycobacteriales bacterium]